MDQAWDEMGELLRTTGCPAPCQAVQNALLDTALLLLHKLGAEAASDAAVVEVANRLGMILWLGIRIGERRNGMEC